MMSARYRFQHLASLVFRHGPDVGLMSFPMSSLSDIGLMSARYRFRHQTSVVFRHRPDIVDDIWPTSSPRANMESARYQPTFADIGPIYFADIRLLSWPTFADMGPTSSLYGFQKSARHRVYIGQISLTTSGRYRPDIFCRHQAAVVADICRYRADIEPLWFSDIGLTSSLYRPDVGLISLTTSGRHRAHVQTWSRPDISRHLPISARYNFRHQADVVADICRYRADIWPIVLCYLGMAFPYCCSLRMIA